MIKAQDLRLNNWVQDADGYGKVTEITDIDITTTSNGLSLPIECYSPILLTPEILGKIEDFAQHGDMLGMWYVRQGDDKQHFIGIMSTDKHPDFYSMFLVSHENDRIAVKRVQYLHEVQNFTYEVTNTELSITL